MLSYVMQLELEAILIKIFNQCYQYSEIIVALEDINTVKDITFYRSFQLPTFYPVLQWLYIMMYLGNLCSDSINSKLYFITYIYANILRLDLTFKIDCSSDLCQNVQLCIYFYYHTKAEVKLKQNKFPEFQSGSLPYMGH